MAVAVGKGSFRGFEEANNRPDASTAGLSTEQSISANLQSISRNVQQMKKMVERLGTKLDSRELRNELSTLQTNTSQLTKQTSTLIKIFEDSAPDDSTKMKEWKLKKQRFKETFHDILEDYSSQQKQIRNKERDGIRESLMKSGYFDVDIDETGSLVKNGEQIEVETLKAANDLDLVKEREEALKQLEHDITDIRDIFNELGKMIQDQGEVLNKVEENVVITEENVTVAVQELEKANTNVQESRRKRCMCIAMVVVVCVIAGVVITVIIVTST